MIQPPDQVDDIIQREYESVSYSQNWFDMNTYSDTLKEVLSQWQFPQTHALWSIFHSYLPCMMLVLGPSNELLFVIPFSSAASILFSKIYSNTCSEYPAIKQV